MSDKMLCPCGCGKEVDESELEDLRDKVVTQDLVVHCMALFWVALFLLGKDPPPALWILVLSPWWVDRALSSFIASSKLLRDRYLKLRTQPRT